MSAAGQALPGPRGAPLLGTFLPFLQRDLLQPFSQLVARYGPLFEVRLPLGHRLVMVAHPEAVEHVLRSGSANYIKGSVYDGTRLLLGRGLVTGEGEHWRRQRELANPAFRPAQLEQYLAVMSDCTAQLLRDWQEMQNLAPVDAQHEMTRLTLAIVGRTLFGLDLSRHSERAADAFSVALAAIGRRGPSMLQLPLWIPTPANLRFRHSLRILDDMIYEIIGSFRAGDSEHSGYTLLGAYMASRDPLSGQGMDDRQLRDEVITLYLAGHETTAGLLSRTLYLLSRHPVTRTRVITEIDSVLAGRKPSIERLKRLQFTSQVINEVLRLYPPAWTIARNAVAEDRIRGYRIRKGSIVMVSPYFTHRQEEFWPEPERFDPDRFAPGRTSGRHPFAYLPFSLGPRVCIGMQFSLYEARLVLGMLLRHFEPQPVPGDEVGSRAAGTLRPAGKLEIRLQRR